MLWEMFPNHPNLLAAYFSEDTHPEMEKYVIKPIFSREGANVSIVENGKVVEALNESLGVVYRDVASTGKIVVIGRP